MNFNELTPFIAALGVAIASIVTSIATLVRARNESRANAAKFEANEQRLREVEERLNESEAEVNVLKAENKQILSENVDIRIKNREIEADNKTLTALLITEEWKRKALEKKIELWQLWGQRIGNAMNKWQLKYGELYTLVSEYQRTGRKVTAPLPPLSDMERFDYPGE